tara:strand:+ start:290 stop:718 length:429 start_codon:yes stop_codon:yes gene_type:complete
MSFAIYHNLIIATSIEKVFDAISQPEHLNNWWTLKCSGKPELGKEYNFNFTDAYDWYGKVSKCELNKVFYIKMTKSDADWNTTTFGFELEEINNTTLLKFSHENWLESNNHFKHTSFCWALLLNGLKNYLEKDVVVPFNDRN